MTSLGRVPGTSEVTMKAIGNTDRYQNPNETHHITKLLGVGFMLKFSASAIRIIHKSFCSDNMWRTYTLMIYVCRVWTTQSFYHIRYCFLDRKIHISKESKSNQTTTTFLIVLLIFKIRADSRFGPNQSETSLQSNAVSHWLGASLESALKMMQCICPVLTSDVPQSQVPGRTYDCVRRPRVINVHAFRNIVPVTIFAYSKFMTFSCIVIRVV